MKTLLLLSILSLLILLPLHLLYWQLFRPVLIERLKYRLFKARDGLRLLAIEGEKDKAYPIVEKFCNKAISNVETVDLFMFFVQRRTAIDIRARAEIEAKRDLEIVFKASAPIRQVFQDATHAAFGAMLVNSPGMVITISPLMVFTVTAFWFNKVKCFLTNRATRAFGNLCFSQ
jgi:hypothetical protein